MSSNSSNFRFVLIGVAILAILVSFWVFARYTVDDAFITWRYGKNLIEFGIWNYNPSTFDMTQAYTNPIFALLSIIPAALGIDTVLFFKLFSVAMLTVFFIYFYKKTQSLLMTLFAYALPATFIHAFSGLETFLFVALMVALFISMDEDKPILATILTMVLFLTRPEAWLLVAMVPLFFLLRKTLDDFVFVRQSIGTSFQSMFTDKAQVRKSLFVFLMLMPFLAAYFLFHREIFGFALPNTFYIKSEGNFSLLYSIKVVLVTAPFFLLLLTKRVALTLLFGGFFLVLGAKYSISTLTMNYTERFLFHIAMPVYFILVYVASKNDGAILKVPFKSLQNRLNLTSFNYLNGAAIFVLLLFLFTIKAPYSMAKIADAYPRGLDAHAAIGKTLKELHDNKGVNSFSLGDAGMPAFHSEINALDNIGLGSSLLGQHGMTQDLIDLYNPKVIIFMSKEKEGKRHSGVDLPLYHQIPLKEWADKHHYQEVCEVYFRHSYRFTVYSDEVFPEFLQLCEKSKGLNDRGGIEYFKDMIQFSPFYYWHE